MKFLVAFLLISFFCKRDSFSLATMMISYKKTRLTLWKVVRLNPPKRLAWMLLFASEWFSCLLYLEVVQGIRLSRVVDRVGLE